MPTKIEWCNNPDGTKGETWNPIRTADGGYHCTKISEGCRGCYAERFNCRFGNGNPFDATPTEFVLDKKQLEKPLHWKKPRKIFVQSMGDMFHEDVPFELIEEVFSMMDECDHHTFIVLTKRPQRMHEFINWYIRRCSDDSVGLQYHVPRHIWLGVTAENQDRADERIPILLQTPAAIRFVSVEPMIGPVVLRRKAADDKEIIRATMMGILDEYSRPVERGIDWVICGGETGSGARPMHPDWARSLRDQCQAAGVPFFLKSMHVVGKIVKMPELDGRMWGEIPNA